MVACYPPPEFPEEPEISFESLRYVPVEGIDKDSLVLVLKFQDGNGDVGLDVTESYCPYHNYNYVVDSSFNLVTISSDSKPPFYIWNPSTNSQIGPVLQQNSCNDEIELFSETDNRPAFDCLFYEIVTQGETSDTCYVVRNKYSRNIFVSFEVKRNGVYIPFEFDESVRQETSGAISCTFGSIWDTRFPILDQINFEEEKPLAGSLEYVMTSNGFELNLRNETFRIQAQIVDRSLNESNIVYSPDFTIFPEFRLNP